MPLRSLRRARTFLLNRPPFRLLCRLLSWGPPTSYRPATVASFSLVRSEGHITSTTGLLDLEPLTGPTAAALRRWQFAPPKHAGAASESAVIVDETFRRPTI